jgi:dihydroorotase
MQEVDLPLLVHGEVTDPDVDIFDRERLFIERRLAPLVERFPGLRIVFEHITSKVAVDFVTAAPLRVAATITAHHLLLNRNDMLVGGIRPHHYCLPVLKRETDRAALLRAATSGNPKFFLGTDSAPHARSAKETACGCAGIYTAHAALEFYAEAFEAMGALDKLEGFAAWHGADFYGLPRNGATVTLIKQSQDVAECLPLGTETVIPLRAGGTLAWRIQDAVNER